MAAAILSYGLIELGRVGDYALVIDNTFLDVGESEADQNINGQFFLLPDPESFSKLFSALGVPFHE